MFAAICAVMDHFLWLADEVKDKFEGKLTEYSDKKRDLKIAMNAVEIYLQGLSKVLLQGIDDIPGFLDMSNVRVYGITDIQDIDKRDPTFSFTVDKVTNQEVIEKLWKGGIAMRAENFYSYAVEVYNIPKVNRLSLVHYNTLHEVKTFLKILHKISIKK
jgi:selenocysteine lyase/cysteine desulfurase